MPNARTLGSRAIATLYCHTRLLLLAICGSAWGDFDALDQQPTLKGFYKLRDSRFTTRAAKPGDHVGYQRWHRDLDR